MPRPRKNSMQNIIQPVLMTDLEAEKEHEKNFSPVKPRALETIFESPKIPDSKVLPSKRIRRSTILPSLKRRESDTYFSKRAVIRQSVLNELDANSYSIPKNVGIAPLPLKTVLERRNAAEKNREKKIVRFELREKVDFEFSLDISQNIANTLRFALNDEK